MFTDLAYFFELLTPEVMHDIDIIEKDLADCNAKHSSADNNADSVESEHEDKPESEFDYSDVLHIIVYINGIELVAMIDLLAYDSTSKQFKGCMFNSWFSW
jgi:hypothetical protein